MAEGEAAVELTTFTAVGDTYVYAPLPPATSYGHRAELWNPDKWMQEVKLKVITAGDLCLVRMLTRESGELFAEVPLPADGTPLTTAVEPVVDSSRYFVVKVVDRESRKHAFIGIGFRDRMDASDFTAALDDYRQYLRRKQEAEQLRQEFDSLQPPGGSNSSGSEAAAEGGDAGNSSGAQQKDFSLKPGETLHIKLSSGLKRGDSGKAGAAGSILRSGSGGGSSPGIVLPPAPGGVPRLAPPGSSSSSSSSSFFRLQPPPPSPAAAAASGAPAAAAGGGQQSSAGPRRASLDGGSTGTAAMPGTAAAAGSATEPAVAEDDWGDFVG